MVIKQQTKPHPLSRPFKDNSITYLYNLLRKVSAFILVLLPCSGGAEGEVGVGGGDCRPGPNVYGRPYWCSRNTFASEIAAPAAASPFLRHCYHVVYIGQYLCLFII